MGDGPLLSRRDFIQRSVRLAVMGAVVPGSITSLLPSLAPSALASTGPGPLLRRDRSNAKFPVTLGDLVERLKAYVESTTEPPAAAPAKAPAKKAAAKNAAKKR